MSKNILQKCTALIIVFFSWTTFANAGFEISEIMYDLDGTDTNREWIEVQNTGTEATDLSKWFFFSDNSKHALAPQGESLVPAGGYAVITQNATNFRADWPNFSGLIFDSSWTGFNNDGEEIALKDPDLNIVSPVAFTSNQGGAGNGDSLQKVSGSWKGGLPTPGVVNQGGSGGGGDEGNSTPAPSTPTAPPIKKKEIEVPKITTSIVSQNTAFAGIPFKITMKTEGYGKEPLKMGRFAWNFGDGMTKNEREHFPFDYVYQYPGEYVITLSYYRVYDGTAVDATDRLTVKVLPSEVFISSVGKDSDPYVEIENRSKIEVDISYWTLSGFIHSFTIPQGTIILPNQKIRFSSKATYFDNIDIQSIVLKSSIGEIASTYPTTAIKTTSTYNNQVSYKNSSKPTTPAVINLDDLGASANNARGLDLSDNTLAWVGLVGVIIVGLITTILIRRRNTNEYIGKDIRASDMTIME